MHLEWVLKQNKRVILKQQQSQWAGGKDQLEKNSPLYSQTWLTECIQQDICSNSSLFLAIHHFNLIIASINHVTLQVISCWGTPHETAFFPQLKQSYACLFNNVGRRVICAPGVDWTAANSRSKWADEEITGQFGSHLIFYSHRPRWEIDQALRCFCLGP